MNSQNESAGAVNVEHLESMDETGSDVGEQKRNFMHGFLRLPIREVGVELFLLGQVACPIVLTGLLLYSRQIISMLFLGHLGNIELAGGSLAIGFGNVTGLSIIKGLSMGMEPICCQAYGAKRFAVLTQTYRKTLCLLLLAAIPIGILWFNVEQVLLLMGQDLGMAKIAKVYLRYSVPELLAQAHLHPLRIFLRAQSLTTPVTVAATMAVILHLPLSYFLTVYLNLGVRGVALAYAWNTLNINVGLVIYLLLSKETLKPWSHDTILSTFQGWKPLLTLALPCACSICLEWWWYEIMLFLCGLLSNPQASVAAMGILYQTTSLVYVFPYSLSLGISTRTGLALGAGHSSRAQWTTIIGLSVAFAYGFLAFAVTNAVKSMWGKLFTSDPQILMLTSSVLPILGLAELGNSPQTAACGALTGSARPNMGARINFTAFYIIGLPVAILMGFKFKAGFTGLWIGLVVAQASCACMMLYTLIRTDWGYQTKRAKELTFAAEHRDDLEANLLQ